MSEMRPSAPFTLDRDHLTGTILLVDDDPNNLAILGELLRPHYKIIATRSGERAVERAATAPQPDLILLDVMMPGMDGYAVLAHLRRHANTRDIPVIFVTSLDSTSDEERGLEMGAVDYITKPYRPPVVLARVHSQLELKRTRDQLYAQNAGLEQEVQRRQQENQQILMQLLQAEKLAAIGQLAAGVGHEINNPVAFVHSNFASLRNYMEDIFAICDAYQALEDSGTGDPTLVAAVQKLKKEKDLDFLRDDVQQLIDESVDGLTRVGKIARDLKDFSRADEGTWKWADLHQGLESTLNIVWSELKHHCKVDKQYGDLPLVKCRPSQLNQVFMNLLVNAGQAIEGQGEITIRTETRGDQVAVSIHDTGKGIPAEHRNRIFEPFFTTKPEGQGTGLGLSMAYNIVKRHHGSLEVDSSPDQGTTFRLILPIDAAPNKDAADPPTS